MANFNISYQIQAIDAFTKVAKQIKTSLRGIQGSLSKVTTKSELAQNSFSKFGKSLATFGKKASLYVGVPMILLGKSILKITSNYEDAMQTVITITHANARQVQMLIDQQHRLAKVYRIVPVEAANAQRIAFARTQDFNGMLQATALSAKLVAATNIDMGDATLASTEIMSAFGGNAKMLHKIVNGLAIGYAETGRNVKDLAKSFTYAGPMANQMGANFESILAVLIAAAKVIPSSMGGRQFRMALAHIAAPSKSAAAGIRILGKYAGVTGNMFLKANGHLEDFRIITQRLAKAKAVIDKTYRKKHPKDDLFNVAIVKAFSVRADELLAILNTQADTLKRVHEGMASTSNLLDVLAKTRMKTLKGSLDKLSTSWIQFKLDVGRTNEGPIKDFIDNLTKMVNKMDVLSPEMKQTFGTAIIGGILAGPTLVGIGKLAIGIGLLAKAFPKMLPFMGTFIARLTLIGTLAGVFVILYEKSEIFRNSVQMVNSALLTMWDAITGKSKKAKKDMQDYVSIYNKVAIGERGLFARAGAYLGPKVSGLLPTIHSIEAAPARIGVGHSESTVRIVVDDPKGYVKHVAGGSTGVQTKLNMGTYMESSR